MSTRTTRKTLIALERTDYVIASIRTQKPTVTEELSRNFTANLPEGTPMPDWDALQEAHALRLESSAEQIRRTEREYRQGLDQMRGYRGERQSVVNELITEYRRLRASAEGNYPEAALTVLGIEQPPIRRYAAVHEQMPEILARLRDPGLEGRMPEPQAGHQPLDFESFAVPLETGIQALEESMETIRQMRKVLDEALLAKREALKENRRTYLNLARVQEGYYRLVGLDELADRVRTEVFLISPRRRGAAKPQADGSPSENGPSAKEATPGAEESTDAPPEDADTRSAA